MHLKTLKLKGFKSFADKTELDFKTAITAIVGPNGSGKSNIAEAFRFVLGEQSMKSLRGKRNEDLIFNGGGSSSRANRASVSLLLDNSNRLLDIDFDEVLIERVVHRDASNEYLIGGSQVRLKDVQELLAGGNIGSTGHHIISQGEADKILSVSSKDRKLMIEDALGLKVFHYRRNESEKKLEKTNENIEKVESLRREIAPHIRFLKKQVEKLDKVREMRNELKSLYKDYLYRERIYVDYFLKKAEDDLKEPEDKLNSLKVNLEESREKASSEQQHTPKIEELKKLESLIDSKREEFNNLSKEQGRIEGEVRSSEKALKRESALITEVKDQRVSVEEVKTLRDEIAEIFKKSIEGERALKDVFQAVKEIFTDFLDHTEDGGSVNKARLDSLEKEIEELQNKERELKEKSELLKKEITELESEYKNLSREIEEQKDSFKDAEKEVFRLMALQSELKSEVNSLKAQKDTLLKAKEDLMQETKEALVLVGEEAVRISENENIGTNEVLSEDRQKQEQRRKDLERLKIKLEEAGVGGGEEILKEYKEVKERDEFLEKEVDDLRQSAEKLRVLIDDLNETLQNKFHKGVEVINKEFSKFFSLMFGGGKASLKVVKEDRRRKKSDFDLDAEFVDDDEEDNEEGVEIEVTLPRKNIRGLQMLSGGERALTSTALLFAMSQVNPPPFIILDETDAALDEANSRKYGDMIEELSEHSQLILITHNRETMSRAGVLYGVTMGGDGTSKLLSVEFDEAVQVSK